MTTGRLCHQQGPACHHPLPRTRARTRTREGRCLQEHLRWNRVPTTLREGDGVTGRAPELQAKVQGCIGNSSTPEPGVGSKLHPHPPHLTRGGEFPLSFSRDLPRPRLGFGGGAFSQGGETPLPLSPSSASSRVWHPKGFLFREKVKVQIPNFRRAGTPVLAPPSAPRPATARLWLTPGPCLPEVPEPHPLLSSAPPPIPDNLLPAQLPASLQPLRG